MPLAPESGIALETLHCGDPHAKDQIGILAVGLLDAAPARLARNIHHGRQRLMSAANAGFLEEDHCLENEIRCTVAQAVADLLPDG